MEDEAIPPFYGVIYKRHSDGRECGSAKYGIQDRKLPRFGMHSLLTVIGGILIIDIF